MRYHIKHTNPQKQRSNCLIVGIWAGQSLSPAAEQLDQASDGYLTRLLKRGDLTGDLGQTLLLQEMPKIAAERVLLVGCGKAEEFNAAAYRKMSMKVIAALKQTGAKEAVNYLTDLVVNDQDLHWKIRQAIQITSEALYVFDQFKSNKTNGKIVLNEMIFNVTDSRSIKQADRAVVEANAIVSGMQLTKNLGNLPANVCTPTYLAKQAQDLAKKYKSITAKILEKKDMEKMGMGALLAVARGSHQPPKLIVLHYNGAAKNKKPIALVGKGVTFDSGGISLKPAAAMEEMKFDMCGAATVLGTLLAMAELKLPINVVGVIPATENLPGGNATKPGDIVTTMSGQTVEIINTDAEGRLILADALTYTEKFQPEVVIDIATLTGAVIIALGTPASGLMSNDSHLVDALKKAGDASSDRVWQLPLWDDYQEQIDSNVADISNVGVGGGKVITAACFLARFTKKLHWAHLDVAGTAFLGGKDKQATGRPVPLLVQYLLDLAK